MVVKQLVSGHAHISKLQPEGVLYKHMRFLCFTDGIHLNTHVLWLFHSTWYVFKHALKKNKSPRRFCPLFQLSQKGSSPEISVYKFQIAELPFSR